MTPSRTRRKEAVNAARKAVYDNKGKDYQESMNPFDDDRRRRIFKKYYLMNHNTYHWYEMIANDMSKAYGYSE